jgi:hypothetical protein
MQVSEHHRTFELGGKVYSYELAVRQVLGLGTSYDVTIRDQAGSIVARRDDCYLTKNTPVAEGLQPLLKSMMDNRPTLESLRTQATTHQVRTDLGPQRPNLWG